MRRLSAAFFACALAVMTLALTEVSVNAWQCDFVTGGGWIPVDSSKATFGVGGGCKHEHYWGHLEYQDHRTGLNVHWISITAYQEWFTALDDKDRLIGRRLICGTARTNDPAHPNVNFAAVVADNGEPGSNDEFAINLEDPGGAAPYYFAGSKLGGGDGGGGNIQLHKPNNSNTGIFGGDCPALN